jgi:hypothetical protein
MIEIWPQANKLAEKIISKFGTYDTVELPEKYKVTSDNFTWSNYLWTDSAFKKAHIEIVDATKSKKMWVMHMCIFPHHNSPDPIFGFDIVAGQHKITGAFHDFSKVGESQIYKWYQRKMESVTWNKKRELPEWAQRIFSPQMLAAGNIQTQEEFDQLANTVLDNLDHYLYNIGVLYSGTDYKEQHNHYCKNQKLNHHTPNMMELIGVNKELFIEFMDEILFPEEK